MRKSDKYNPLTSLVDKSPQEAKTLAYEIADLAQDKKAKQIVVMDLNGKTSIADFFVLMCGESDTQIKAIADHIVKELKGKPELMVCPAGDQAWGEEGLKVIDPKLTYKVTKAMPWGDPYCEDVIEFKEE